MKKRLVTLALSAGIAVSLAGCGNNFSSEPLENALKDVPMTDVELLDSYERNAFELEVRYLKKLG